MSLLWGPMGHVALASAALESTLTERGPINDSRILVTVRSLRISMINVDPRPSHTREGYQNLNPHSIA